MVMASNPMWRVKAMWRATSVVLLVNAKDENDAWDRAWKRVARTEGGDMCLEVKVLGLA
jgi:hypothetical protein